MIQGYTVKNNTIIRFFELSSMVTIAAPDEEVVVIDNQDEFELIRNKFFQEQLYNNHNDRMILERQQKYRELNTSLLGLIQIGEATQEDYEDAVRDIKVKHPKLEEMTLEEKQAMYPLLDAELVEE